jgi:hypothetical protein
LDSPLGQRPACGFAPMNGAPTARERVWAEWSSGLGVSRRSASQRVRFLTHIDSIGHLCGDGGSVTPVTGQPRPDLLVACHYSGALRSSCVTRTIRNVACRAASASTRLMLSECVTACASSHASRTTLRSGAFDGPDARCPRNMSRRALASPAFGGSVTMSSSKASWPRSIKISRHRRPTSCRSSRDVDRLSSFRAPWSRSLRSA